jgi:hypothetical protein
MNIRLSPRSQQEPQCLTTHRLPCTLRSCFRSCNAVCSTEERGEQHDEAKPWLANPVGDHECLAAILEMAARRVFAWLGCEIFFAYR